MTELKQCRYHAAATPGVRVAFVESQYGIDSGCQVFCDLCGGAGPIKHDEDDAIAAWNRRALVPAPDEVRAAYYRCLDTMGEALNSGRNDVYVRKATEARAIAETITAYSGPDALKELEDEVER